jgi:hypothetical protein
MLDDELHATQKRRVDPLTLRGLIYALEGMNRFMLERSAFEPTDVARAKRAMVRILGATLAAEGDVVPPLPAAPPARPSAAPKARYDLDRGAKHRAKESAK